MTPQQKKKIDLSQVMFIVSCAGAVFFYGVAVGAFNIFPYPILNAGFDAVRMVWGDREALLSSGAERYTMEGWYEGEGVTGFDASRAEPGFTLLTGFFDEGNEIRLVDLDGTVVNRWPVRYSDYFPETDHIEPRSSRPASDLNTDIHGAVALPDGSIVFNFEYHGMVKLDRCRVPSWTVDRMTHHSMDFAVDGGFWVGGRQYQPEGSTSLPPFVGPYKEDTVLRISEDGTVLSEFSVPGAFFKSGLEALFLANGRYRVSEISTYDEELVHLNDIEELTPELASAFPMFEAGDLLLSLRHMNMILVVDPETEQVKWHRIGPWIRQHDPDFQPDGTITVFDNRSDGTDDGTLYGGSRVIRIRPDDDGSSVVYGGTPEQKFYTRVRGKHQILRNGNTLVVEALQGRVVEATPEGETVWEYINRYNEARVSRLSDAVRYPESYFEVTDWSCS